MRKYLSALLLASVALSAVAPAAGPKFSTSGGIGSADSTFSGGEPNGGTYTINGTTGRVSAPIVNLRPGSAPASPQNGDCWTTVAGLFCRINDVTVGPYQSSAGAGTVTQVGLVPPSIFTAGGAVTTSGNLSFSLNSQSANLVFAAPTGSSGTPGFRALVGADIPAVNVGASGNGGVTGTLGIANGGTGGSTALAARNALGLGTAATQNTGTSGANVPLLNGANTWSASQAFAGVTVGTFATGAQSLEVSGTRATDGPSIVDLHATTGTDYEARLIRNTGVNGDLSLTNTGTGTLSFSNNGLTGLSMDSAGLVSLPFGATLPNAKTITARNAANTANLEMLSLDSSNLLRLGYGAAGTQTTFGNPVIQGGLNYPNDPLSKSVQIDRVNLTGTRTISQVARQIELTDGQVGPESGPSTPTPNSASYGLAITGYRTNWQTSGITGEMDGIYVGLRQANSDTAAMLANVGVRNGFAAVIESNTSAMDVDANPIKTVRTQLGVANPRDNFYMGLGLSSEVGTNLDVGLRIYSYAGSSWARYMDIKDPTGADAFYIRGSDAAVFTKTVAPLSQFAGNIGAPDLEYDTIYGQFLKLRPTTYAVIQGSHPCNSTNKGFIARITDSAVAVTTFNQAITAGAGSFNALITCDGTNWRAISS